MLGVGGYNKGVVQKRGPAVAMTRNTSENNMSTGIFWITTWIAQGGYPDSKRIQRLHQNGITHIFNVGTTPLQPQSGAHEIAEVNYFPIEDLKRLPDVVLLKFLNAFHAVMMRPSAKSYIHCVAGQNRSPTLLWLYFVACGLAADEARDLIEERTLDAIAGHSALIDNDLIQVVRDHGAKRFLPLIRHRDFKTMHDKFSRLFSHHTPVPDSAAAILRNRYWVATS